MIAPHPNAKIDTPVTWADGYGFWHCRVPATIKSPWREARKRIADQLDMRGQLGLGERVYLERIHVYGDGSVEYTERRN